MEVRKEGKIEDNCEKEKKKYFYETKKKREAQNEIGTLDT